MMSFCYRNIIGMVKTAALCVILLLINANDASAQPERKHLRGGNREFRAGNYDESELSYRRATEIERNNPLSWFNLGNAVYRQGRFDEAASMFERNRTLSEDPLQKAAGFYNMGNAFLHAGDLINSIEAYKNSLRHDPDNIKAKYNLAFAQDLLEEQQQQQDESDGEGDDGDDENKEGDDQSGEDENENKDKHGSDEGQGDSNDGEEREKETEISPDDARRLLDAIAANEQKILDDIARKNATANRVRTLINW